MKNSAIEKYQDLQQKSVVLVRDKNNRLKNYLSKEVFYLV